MNAWDRIRGLGLRYWYAVALIFLGAVTDKSIVALIGVWVWLDFRISDSSIGV
jgi:hypothetical protein